MSENIVTVNNDNFEQEVLKSDTPVLVDFWAEWCGPCKRLLPMLDDIEKELSGQVKICKANIDEASKSVKEFGVASLPTLMVFKEGKVVKKSVGARGKKEIIAMVQDSINE